MKLPFHGVQVCGGVLFAAKGGAVHSFQLADGSHVSSWRYTGPARDEEPPATEGTDLVVDVSDKSAPAPSQDDLGPPAKRVKLDDGGAPVEPTSGEGQAQRNGKQDKGKKNKKQKPASRAGALSRPSERPMVILTTAAKDGSHLVAVTSDKSIWVFEHDGKGHLKQLSCRYVEILMLSCLFSSRHHRRRPSSQPDHALSSTCASEMQFANNLSALTYRTPTHVSSQNYA